MGAFQGGLTRKTTSFTLCARPIHVTAPTALSPLLNCPSRPLTSLRCFAWNSAHWEDFHFTTISQGHPSGAAVQTPFIFYFHPEPSSGFSFFHQPVIPAPQPCGHKGGTLVQQGWLTRESGLLAHPSCFWPPILLTPR